MASLYEFIRRGKAIPDDDNPISAHREFRIWDEEVGEWLEENFPNSGLAASWSVLPSSQLVTSHGYYDDPTMWLRYHAARDTRLKWLADLAQKAAGELPASARRPATSSRISRLFLSHASEDRALAEHIRERLLAGDSNLQVFLASLPGHIPAGADWLAAIKKEIEQADAYLVLLTPASVNRPWVIFETGAAWMSKRTLLTMRAGGLASGDVPMPLSSFQTLSFEDPRESSEAFTQIGVSLERPEEFAALVKELGGQRNDLSEEGWQGVFVGGRYFAWEGPSLFNLDDRQPIVAPPELLKSISDLGLTPRFGNRARLTNHLAAGRRQVYETDRKGWRREIINAGDPGQVLLVREPRGK